MARKQNSKSNLKKIKSPDDGVAYLADLLISRSVMLRETKDDLFAMMEIEVSERVKDWLDLVLWDNPELKQVIQFENSFPVNEDELSYDYENKEIE